MFNSGGGVSNDSSDSEMEDKTTANLALLKLDEWLHLKLDPEVSSKSLLGLLHVEECVKVFVTFEYPRIFSKNVMVY